MPKWAKDCCQRQGERDLLVEEIAHAIHEDRAGLLPGKGKLEAIRPEAKVEALLVGMAWNPTPSFRERLSVAVLAPGADLIAARHGVPG
jgi:hypothetical protein